jgi:hypothetical protein
MNKPHLKLTSVDLSAGWVTPPGYPAVIQQKIVASSLDEGGKTGSPTRLLCFGRTPTRPRRLCMITTTGSMSFRVI